ncbi:MAG: hypothetical protein ACI849_001098 [Patiriisocius sp.]|jgi:hypothetical protein
MFSKNKNKPTIDTETREQYEYARKRIKQKKGLMRHFVFFLAGSLLFIILDPVLNMGHKTLLKDWYIWIILIWTFILLIHLFNVFIIHTFMGKEWEDKQLEKLKSLQEIRISKLKKQAIQDVTLEEVKKAKEEDALPVKKKDSNPNLLAPENL